VADRWGTFVESLFAGHRRRLLGFFHRRIRIRSDASDLVQEVYLRMLRVRNSDEIRNPEVYLYTIAANLVREHAVLDRRVMCAVDIDRDDLAIADAAPEAAELLDTEQRVSRLREAIADLSPKCRAAVVLQYRYGLKYEEIAARLGISTHMVKKYHSQAIVHCRQWLERHR
jgi:RNA polymerase sigma factor (sigma-70 family)